MNNRRKPLPPNPTAVQLAETLLAVTLSATSSVQSDDWETAGQLLRRREQLLTQLERCPDLKFAEALLIKVQKAELFLMSHLEKSTRETFDGINRDNNFQKAKKTYETRLQPGGWIERTG